MSVAGRCEVCEVEPLWYLTRIGDVVVSWACPDHVSEVLLRLQRPHEVTEVVAVHHPKAVEWAEVGAALAAIVPPASRPGEEQP